MGLRTPQAKKALCMLSHCRCWESVGKCGSDRSMIATAALFSWSTSTKPLINLQVLWPQYRPGIAPMLPKKSTQPR